MRKLMHFSTIFKASNHLLGYGVFVSLKYKHRASKRTINHHLTMFGSEKMVTCAKKEHFLQLFSGLRSISNFASLNGVIKNFCCTKKWPRRGQKIKFFFQKKYSKDGKKKFWDLWDHFCKKSIF